MGLTLTNSELTDFKRCGRKWYLKHFRMLRRRHDVKPVLTIGTLVHHGLEEYYRGGEHPLEYVAKKTAEMMAESPEHADEIRKNAELVGIMLEGYMEWLESDGADVDLDVYDAEKKLEVTLTPTDYVLRGKIDARVRRRSDGSRLFLEHKTVQNLADIPKTAQINSQFKTYSLLEMMDVQKQIRASRALPGVQPAAAVDMLPVSQADQADGQPVGSASQGSQPLEQPGSELGSSSPVMPSVSPHAGSQQHAGARSLARDTRSYVDGSLEVVGETPVRTDGVLINMLRKVKRTVRANPPFYGRHEVHFNLDEIRNHWRHVVSIAEDIERTRARLDAGEDHHRVVPPVQNRDCTYACPFFAVCDMFDDGSDVEGALASKYEVHDPNQRYAEDEEREED